MLRFILHLYKCSGVEYWPLNCSGVELYISTLHEYSVYITMVGWFKCLNHLSINQLGH